jgi:hypothetical protein
MEESNRNNKKKMEEGKRKRQREGSDGDISVFVSCEEKT